MALTKTVAEVKEMLPNFVSNLSIATSLPNFDTPENKYLVPIIGIDLYNDIQTKYDAVTLTTDETKLLKKMRLVTVAHAYHDGLAMGDITLTDYGFRTMAPKDAVPIPRWKFLQMQSAILNIAYDATETLLNYLFETAPALWTASDEYATINSLLIKTGTDFSLQYSLYQPMRTFFSIRSVIADQQELYIKESIGNDLLTHILEEAAPDDTLIAITKKLKKALAFYTVKRCCQMFTVRFSMEGMTVLSQGGADSPNDEGRRSADPIDLDMKMKTAERDGYDFLAKAKYDLWKYRNATTGDVPDAGFNTAFDAGPLASYADPLEAVSGNEERKGIFRL